MPVMTLSNLHKKGDFVSADMFGANVVFATTDGGAPSDAFTQAAGALGVTNIRFGGGQADLDPDKASADGDLPTDGVDALNIVTMPGGALRSEVVNFLEWCEQANAAGQPTRATLIIPTKHLPLEEYVDFAAEIESFVTAVMLEYGDLISAFQIGNEYWEMGETVYGVKASIGVSAVERGMINAGFLAEDQPDILVQMASAGNAGSEFAVAASGADFVDQNAAANLQIINQLSDTALAAIDGVTEHYYYNRVEHDFDYVDPAVKNISRDFQIWSDRFYGDLDLHITEWNVKTTADSQQGMVAGSSLIKQFDYMVDLGVDGAHIWALDYHSRTALTLDTDAGVRLDAQGRVTNSAQAAVFDLMEGSIIGKELVNASFSGNPPGIKVSSYASDQEMVFYISSRNLETSSFTLDLAAKLPTDDPVLGVKISMDPETSNGLQWDQGVAADSVLIDGEPYYYNEHDVDVVYTDLVFDDASQIELELDPFEIVELTIALGQGEVVTPSPDPKPDPLPQPEPEPVDPQIPVTSEKHYYLGDAGDNVLLWTDNVVYVDAGEGVDTVIIQANSDEAYVKIDGFGKPVLTVPGVAPAVTLNNVERVQFDDGLLAVDIEGNSGQAYRLYQASFDRTPDAAGLEFWMEQLDSGAISLLDAAELFLASAEFAATYGNNETLADSDYIDLLYENVLGRLPDQAGYDFWNAKADENVSRELMLVSFSESTENKAKVAPAIDDGIWFA